MCVYTINSSEGSGKTFVVWSSSSWLVPSVVGEVLGESVVGWNGSISLETVVCGMFKILVTTFSFSEKLTKPEKKDKINIIKDRTDNLFSF